MSKKTKITIGIIAGLILLAVVVFLVGLVSRRIRRSRCQTGCL